MKKRKGTHIIVIALIAAGALLSCFLTACLTSENRLSEDAALVAWVRNMDTKDVREAAGAIRSVENSRKESSLEESRKESASAQSSIDESLSISESESLVIYESESWEEMLSSIAESIATGGTPTGKMAPGKVFTVGDEAIPLIRQLFSDVVVLGNSRAKSVLDSGILTERTVLYKWAAHMDEITEMVQQAASLQRGKALFMMGVNDLGYYMANVEKWRRDYIAMIDLFRSINPDAEIYLQEIIPINENYRYRWHNMDRVVRYNEVLYEIAEATGTTVVRVTDFAFPEFLNDDTGAHYDKRFHFYWAQTLANQMGLWEGHEPEPEEVIEESGSAADEETTGEDDLEEEETTGPASEETTEQGGA